MSDAADIIKQSVSMWDASERYGHIPNRAGFICCPFHNEKTPSLKIYKEPDRGWHCFGCGLGGSVIDFVMALFGISFKQAIIRLNADFSLGLINSKPDLKEVLRLKNERFQREKAKAEEKKMFNRLIERYRHLNLIKKYLSPKYLGRGQILPEWEQAVWELPYIEYLLDGR